MKIAEARQRYSAQIKTYHEQQTVLSKKKQELEEKMNSVPNGKTIYANEAAILELTMAEVEEKKAECQEYMNRLQKQWAGIANMVSAEQQAEAMEEYVDDLGKIMEVARRFMKGGIVPATDEKKLMEYSMEMYQAAKNIGAMVKQREREKYDSLWEEEDKDGQTECVDPMETADNAEPFADGPKLEPETSGCDIEL